MTSPRDRMGILKVIGDIPFVVYGYEPSTGYMWFVGGFVRLQDAIEKAKSKVDDATRTEGWVYTHHQTHYLPAGRAFMAGDGDTEYEVWKSI